MKEKYEGASGERLRFEAFRRQRIVQSDEIAQKFSAVSKIEEFGERVEFIKQGASETDVFFILFGKVRILVNGRQIGIRVAGQHVGEMAMIDIYARRSASVVAVEMVVVARVTEGDFSRIATEHPELWRWMAIEIADRLRQRNSFVRQVNEEPVIFLGSSAEALPIARAFRAQFEHDRCFVRPWTNGVFGVGEMTIENLMQQVLSCDYAVLVLTADDLVLSRDKVEFMPRDNVIFELGLFMGQLDRRRALMLVERKDDIKIPTDLLGIKALEYKMPKLEADLAAAMGTAADEVRARMNALGPV